MPTAAISVPKDALSAHTAAISVHKAAISVPKTAISVHTATLSVHTAALSVPKAALFVHTAALCVPPAALSVPTTAHSSESIFYSNVQVFCCNQSLPQISVINMSEGSKP